MCVFDEEAAAPAAAAARYEEQIKTKARKYDNDDNETTQ